MFNTAIDNAIAQTQAAYDRMLFRDALKSGMYDMQSARDVYRFACGPEGMNRQVIQRYIEVSCKLVAPIVPHTADHIWIHMLKKSGSVLNSGFPVAQPVDFALMQASKYLEDQIPALRKSIMLAEKPAAKKGKPAEPAGKVTGMSVYVKEEFTGWNRTALELLQAEWDAATNGFKEGADARVMEGLMGHADIAHLNEKARKGAVMPFVKFRKEQAVKLGAQALDVKLPFDERKTLMDNMEYLLRTLTLETITVDTVDKAPAGVETKDAAPGNPVVNFIKVDAPTA